MEFILGRVFVYPSLPGMSRSEKELVYLDAIRIISNIHTLTWDSKEIELHDYGGRPRCASATKS